MTMTMVMMVMAVTMVMMVMMMVTMVKIMVVTMVKMAVVVILIWTKTAQQHARLCTGVRRMIGAASTEKLTVSVACRHSPRAIHVAKPGSFISNVVGVATA